MPAFKFFKIINYLLGIFFIAGTGIYCTERYQITDPIADKMLLYQRDDGGWPQYKGDPTDYALPISTEFTARLLKDKSLQDATIDDRSTTYEIKYLLQKFSLSHNDLYLKSAENGIRYLLAAQNGAGGWPQKYPDTIGYHHHITYNDEAMISVMWIMKGLVDRTEPYDKVDKKLRTAAQLALSRGIACILHTQYRQGDSLTVWCAQHDAFTLAPAPARAFEPASLSGKESVGILLFLKSLPDTSQAILASIRAGTAWLRKVKLQDIALQTVEDKSAPRGIDRIVIKQQGSVLWARFYDLETNQPIFMGRNKIPQSNLSDIEIERRTGYAYLGTWPKTLFKND